MGNGRWAKVLRFLISFILVFVILMLVAQKVS